MFVPFDSLPSSARVWIYQANRPLSSPEKELAATRLREFTGEWAVHGTPIPTSFTIQHNQFIVLAADESSQAASGCSIDSSVRVLKDIEGELGISLFDRSQVAFWSEGKVLLIPLAELKENFRQGILNERSLAFNNLVQSKGAFDNSWLAPADETWLKRYIPNPLAKVK